MALKTWDEYVANANREPLTLPVKGGTITITMPSSEQVDAFNVAMIQAKREEALKALLGEKAGSRVYNLGRTAPYGTLDTLINDILVEFGLRPGNSETSSS